MYQQLAARTGRGFLEALRALPEFNTPALIGRLRIQVTVVDGDIDLGYVDVDPVNLGDLADITARRAAGLHAKHTPTIQPAGKPTLRLVGGAR